MQNKIHIGIVNRGSARLSRDSIVKDRRGKKLRTRVIDNPISNSNSNCVIDKKMTRSIKTTSEIDSKSSRVVCGK